MLLTWFILVQLIFVCTVISYNKLYFTSYTMRHSEYNSWC